ncbi:lipoyl(octanoyl) transferase LipB [Persicobacter psychrovividus]|uniref:Octanoyltransferase n=1 Tax=Persicobacter psychrovividus TaxID=387638 RepID=A0ABM7VGL9_9BACT|nr:octanoyltransferase [Persicobacter psychrovividus]
MNPKINKQVQFKHLGLIDYQEAWDYQEEVFKNTVDLKIANRKLEESAQKITENFLLFCEHPHVYTLGKSGKPEHLLLNDEQLKEKSATYYKINRGGDITYHGPGQIVAYPILDLENFFTDIHKYMRYMEEAVIMTCADYGIKAGRVDGLTGVWIGFEEMENPRKICAMGVKSSRWVTMHGLAFNVNTQMEYFKNIVPCGISDKAVTSLAQELNMEMDMKAVEEKLKRHLATVFEMELI